MDWAAAGDVVWGQVVDPHWVTGVLVLGVLLWRVGREEVFVLGLLVGLPAWGFWLFDDGLRFVAWLILAGGIATVAAVGGIISAEFRRERREVTARMDAGETTGTDILTLTRDVGYWGSSEEEVRHGIRSAIAAGVVSEATVGYWYRARMSAESLWLAVRAVHGDYDAQLRAHAFGEAELDWPALEMLAALGFDALNRTGDGDPGFRHPNCCNGCDYPRRGR